jgi:hypothetical protein
VWGGGCQTGGTRDEPEDGGERIRKRNIKKGKKNGAIKLNRTRKMG